MKPVAPRQYPSAHHGPLQRVTLIGVVLTLAAGLGALLASAQEACCRI